MRFHLVLAAVSNSLFADSVSAVRCASLCHSMRPRLPTIHFMSEAVSVLRLNCFRSVEWEHSVPGLPAALCLIWCPFSRYSLIHASAHYICASKPIECYSKWLTEKAYNAVVSLADENRRCNLYTWCITLHVQLLTGSASLARAELRVCMFAHVTQHCNCLLVTMVGRATSTR